ncbi:hypothetical protein [Myxococcus landrumensis]|uniref:DUF3168 domain-containing protein n=1 Tax=Myxococcus landrumensis TaxID=2813577 RepID=A0ABX7NEK1_9BACT|nr:hypothetical protein [Myxococcus landrumus]QSQ17234.1 hypothetical protein JY572_14735 [Myxococcus landrumus]
MTPRHVERELALHLESSGLGLSTTSTASSLYWGGLPTKSPDRAVLVRDTGGEQSLYLGTGRGLLAADAQVVVRGVPNRVEEARELAVACWRALHLARIPGFVGVKCEGAGPIAQPPDGSGRPRLSFNVIASFVA